MSDDEQTTEKPLNLVEERWAYAGRRIAADGTVAYAWVEDEGRGNTYLLTKNYKAVIGYVYIRKVHRADNGTASIYGEPQITGTSWSGADRVEDPRPQWQAADEAVGQFLLRKRLQNAAAKEAGDLDKIIAPLLQAAAQLRTARERDAMTAYVIGQMNKVWYVAGRSGIGR